MFKVIGEVSNTNVIFFSVYFTEILLYLEKNSKLM